MEADRIFLTESSRLLIRLLLAGHFHIPSKYIATLKQRQYGTDATPSQSRVFMLGLRMTKYFGNK